MNNYGDDKCSGCKSTRKMAENVECVKELNHDSRRITTHAMASLNCNTSYLLTYKDGTMCSEMLAFKLQTPVNNPEESI
jgi:hypothetical protein